MSRFNLRRKPRISYYELEEPNLDEYIYCDECTDFVYEYCAIHGPLLVVPDDKVISRAGIPPWVPRAALTVPREFIHIAPSIIPRAGLGIFSTLTLPKGVRFGPYRGKHTDEAKSMYCWQIKSPDLKSRTVVDAFDGETSNWMRYVNCARNWHEQNLVAYQYQGQIFYRTIKIIPRFSELLVFYGSEFARALGIDLRHYNAPPRFAKYGAPPAKHPKVASEEPKASSIKPTPVIDENHNFVEKIENRKDLENLDNNEPGQFKIDDKILQNNLSLDKQMKDHNVDVSKIYFKYIFKCKFCDYKNISNAILERHMRFHDSDRAHECNICQRRFNRIDSLKIHLRTHTGEEPYECNICQRRFNQNSHLKYHLRTHTGEKPYECNICQRRFNETGSLKTHLRTHTGEKPYECNICQRRFNETGSLKTHLRTHTGEKPYECNICQRRFNHISNLKRHLRTHTGEKPYECNICQRRFNHIGTLKTHLITHTARTRI